MDRLSRQVALFLIVCLALPAAAEPQAAQSEDPDTSRGRWGIAPFPVLMISPETGFGGGAGSVLTYREPGRPATDRPQSLSLILLYTAKGQALAALSPVLYLGGNDSWRIEAGLSYKNFPSLFYGIGNDSYEGDEEEYVEEAAGFSLNLQKQLAGGLRAGMILEAGRTSIMERDAGGFLHPTDNRLERPVEGYHGGSNRGMGPVLEWDTRDNTFFPAHGSYHRIQGIFYGGALGGDFEYEGYQVDLRHYLPVGRAHLLAFQAAAVRSTSGTPFYELPATGDLLRGVSAERFRDHTLASLQAEYRFPIRGRFGAAAFLGGGGVSESPSTFRLDELKLAGGAGLRFALNPEEKINVRIDFGVSKYGVEPYIALSEAF